MVDGRSCIDGSKSVGNGGSVHKSHGVPPRQTGCHRCDAAIRLVAAVHNADDGLRAAQVHRNGPVGSRIDRHSVALRVDQQKTVGDRRLGAGEKKEGDKQRSEGLR